MKDKSKKDSLNGWTIEEKFSDIPLTLQNLPKHSRLRQLYEGIAEDAIEEVREKRRADWRRRN